MGAKGKPKRYFRDPKMAEKEKDVLTLPRGKQQNKIRGCVFPGERLKGVCRGNSRRGSGMLWSTMEGEEWTVSGEPHVGLPQLGAGGHASI